MKTGKTWILSILSGFGQIGFTENAKTGLLFIIAVFTGSFEQGICGILGTASSVLFACFLKEEKSRITQGLCSYNGALAGLCLPVLLFPEQGLSVEMLAVTILAGLLCAAGSCYGRKWLEKWQLPVLALPYSVCMAFLVPFCRFLELPQMTHTVMPYIGGLVEIETKGNFLQVFAHNISQVLWQASALTAAFYLIGMCVASVSDLVITMVSSITTTAMLCLLCYEQEPVLWGIYGYNSILFFQALYGRQLKKNRKTAALVWFCALLLVPLTRGFELLFKRGQIPVTSLPYVTLAYFALFMKRLFQNKGRKEKTLDVAE